MKEYPSEIAVRR